MNRRVLVADDEKNMRWVLSQALQGEGYEVREASDGKEALSAIAEQEPDLLVLDHKMPAPDGMEVLRRIRAKGLGFPVIMLTAHGNVQTAVEAMKAGANEYLTKPFDLDELKIAIEKALRMGELAAEVARLRAELDRDWDVEGIVVADPSMLEVLSTIEKVAPTGATVIVYGESGTGKELVARALHRLSARSAKPFVSISAGALPETLLESELFGYEKGAFTGAVMAKPGRFEMANGGTLFLDEIGDISSGVQVKLLRVLQERTFERLGGTRSIEVDVRVVAATNRDLQQLIADGSFREDLFYRLNVVVLSIPPLRERKEDIPLLIDHFLQRFSTENGKRIEGISREARDLLLKYAYPGNVRELENIIERAVVISRESVISVEDLPFGGAAPEAREDSDRDGGVLRDSVEDLERRLIREAMEKAGDHQTRAAEFLGISERMLRYKLKKYGLKS